jgi:hypothetical protein
MRTLPAFACRLRGFKDETILHAQTASKARYSFLLDVQETYPDSTFKDISVRRAEESDLRFPDLPPTAESIDARDREIILHTYGGGNHIRSTQWGYRNHWCGSPKDERLLKLVELGLFRGPCGTDAKGDAPGWCGAFFYLTDAGIEMAQALIGERECAA